MSQSNGAHVVAIIPRGEVVRNFVYSAALDRVAEETQLSLLAVSMNGEVGKMLNDRYKNVYPLGESNERWIVGIQREILDMAHGRWLWSKAAQERWRLRDAEATTPRRKIGRNIKKMVSAPFASRSGLRVLGKLERRSSHLLRTTDHYRDLFKRLRPTLVFNGSHVHSSIATQAVQEAQRLGIPTATFIFSWDNLTSQGRIILPYDYFFVWNETLRKQLLEMYDWIRSENVFVTGTPQFDFHFDPELYQSREDFCRSIGADPRRPIVLYSTGMANHMPGEPEIVEGIADMLGEMKESPQLLVRVYPKDRTGRFDELKERRKDILFPTIAWEPSWLTPKYEDSFALVNSLRHSAVGINVASTIALELCMFDKPVINVGYNPDSVSEEVVSYARYYKFDHYEPIVESGAVEVAYSKEEMKRKLEKAFADPGERKNERRDLIAQMFGSSLDGRSGLRIGQKLAELAKKGN